VIGREYRAFASYAVAGRAARHVPCSKRPPRGDRHRGLEGGEHRRAETATNRLRFNLLEIGANHHFSVTQQFTARSDVLRFLAR
jgi:hypothetical protein